MTNRAQNILVIKHGAFGDVVLAQALFQAIRAHHPAARITLLTTALFKPFLEKSGLFDDIWVDDKPKLWQVRRLLALKRKLRSGNFDRVYDLQTSSRSSSYLKLFPAGRRPEWSGVAPGCSHPHRNPNRGRLHTVERQSEQLAQAGITDMPPADFSWAIKAARDFALPVPYALLVPGGSAHRPEKRWPAASYGALAGHLVSQGVTPVLIGGKAEADVLAEICGICPEAIDLSSKTSLEDLAGLGAGAALAVGNDTGPLHMIAAVGCPVTVLFSRASDPSRARPRGQAVTVLQRDDLASLSLDAVIATLPSGA
ncbi:glycosyltransferase family 9 protein [Sneathiella chinensis]|uniref:Glycosyl transferase n=1 Tax=Sneathiella chinensis TaxID=349750 RepID=A0ABQ5TZT6_9PROT|nr:glycosyltransferase family 9 protein [Sneathiella chinensis]GLQ05377.1 glycosyl transferase [Sneathiella chinensis]